MPYRRHVLIVVLFACAMTALAQHLESSGARSIAAVLQRVSCDAGNHPSQPDHSAFQCLAMDCDDDVAVDVVAQSVLPGHDADAISVSATAHALTPRSQRPLSTVLRI